MVKQVVSMGGSQWEGGGYKKGWMRVNIVDVF
jgi:hypothetical protein